MNRPIYCVTITAFAEGRSGAAYSLNSRDLPDAECDEVHADPWAVAEILLQLPDIDRVQIDVNLDTGGSETAPAPEATR